MESFLKIFALVFLFTSPGAFASSVALDTKVREEMIQIILKSTGDATTSYEAKMKVCAATLQDKCSDCDVAKRSEKRLFGSLLKNVVESALMVLMAPLNSLKMLVTVVVNTVATLVSVVSSALEAIVRQLVTSLQAILGRLLDALEEVVTIVLEAVVVIVAEVTTLLKNLIGVLAVTVKNILARVSTVVMDLLNQLANLANSLLQIVNGLVNVVTGILDSLLGVVTGLLGGLGGLLSLGKRELMYHSALERREFLANKEKRQTAELTLNTECGDDTVELITHLQKLSDVYFQAYSHITAAKMVVVSHDASTISYNAGCKSGSIANNWGGAEESQANAIAIAILADAMV